MFSNINRCFNLIRIELILHDLPYCHRMILDIINSLGEWMSIPSFGIEVLSAPFREIFSVQNLCQESVTKTCISGDE